MDDVPGLPEKSVLMPTQVVLNWAWIILRRSSGLIGALLALGCIGADWFGIVFEFRVFLLAAGPGWRFLFMLLFTTWLDAVEDVGSCSDPSSSFCYCYPLKEPPVGLIAVNCIVPPLFGNCCCPPANTQEKQIVGQS